MKKPMGVSTYQLPKHLQENLPTIEQLEAELETLVRIDDD
jgi:hypothetical protein